MKTINRQQTKSQAYRLLILINRARTTSSISLDEVIEADDDGSQLCLDCAEWQGMAESDAIGIPCEICGSNQTIGAHWLIVGEVTQ